MSTLGERIKYARESKGYLQNELAKLIGVKSAAVISNWEKGLNKPDAEKIVKLCNVLDVSASFLLDYYGKSSFEFTFPEEEFIKKYRSLDSYGQETVNMILDREICRFKQLQDASDSPVVEFHDRSGSQMRIYSYMHKIASAGNGFYFDDIPTETMEAPYIDDADFIIGVSGDSMEPTYHDGDLVYVHKCQTIEIGDIGIFIVNGECYIKEAGEYGLVSHNRKYPIIPGSEHIICVGKVLGKVDR
ncbi:MAG: XRE family transcriptional regulator [Blautia sp.]|nr:XRE family transcriptional regulator [Blautia sp.]MDY5031196.1 XRE family transcriptional regulator [Blautia sp.]